MASVNEELGQAGGVVVVMGGDVHDLVRDYDQDYDLQKHQQEIRPLLKRLDTFLGEAVSMTATHQSREARRPPPYALRRVRPLGARSSSRRRCTVLHDKLRIVRADILA